MKKDIDEAVKNFTNYTENRFVTKTPEILTEQKIYFYSTNGQFNNFDCDKIVKSVKPYLSVHKNTIKIKNTAELLNKLNVVLKQYCKEKKIDFEKQWKKQFNYDYVEVEYFESGTDLIYPQLAGEHNDKFLTMMVFLSEDTNGSLVFPDSFIEERIEKSNVVVFPYSWMYPYKFAGIKKPTYVLKTTLQISPIKDDYVEILDK